MKAQRLQQVPIRAPAFTCDTNAVHASLEEHPALRTFNRYNTTLVIGQPGSGKSSLATALITGKGRARVFRKRMDHIVVFQPTSSRQSMQEDPFTGEVSLDFPELDIVNLTEAYEAIQGWSEAGEKTLVYIDDCTVSLKVKAVEELLSRMSFNRRHLKLNLIITSQIYNRLPMGLRKSASVVVLFHMPNKKEISNLFEELLSLDQEQWRAMSRYVYQHRPGQRSHDFILLDTVNQLYFKNMDEHLTFPDQDDSCCSDEES